MTILQALARPFRGMLERRNSLFDAAYFANLGGIVTSAGTEVNSRTAENLSTVLACVSAISTAIGSLPTYVYRRVGKGREEDPAHPLARLIAQGPNRHQTWPDFVEWLMASVLLRGNGLAEILSDGRGAVLELRPIPWEWVSVQMLPSGRLAYDVTDMNPLYGGSGRSRRLLEGEVLHLKDRSDDGLIGRSRLSRAAEVVGTALAGQEFAGSLMRNGINPSGAILVEGRLTREQSERLRESFRQAYQGANRPENSSFLIRELNGSKSASARKMPRSWKAVSSPLRSCAACSRCRRPSSKT
jgi:HK97 family phage portal protein